ncbi:MAG: hypothetical protein H8D55_01400 [Deltaproteobacteria bacterium]|nr:hypothetical protein [Deltaproteobacteria bacterium]
MKSITLQKLSEIRCPTLVVQGIKDKTNLPEMSEVLARSVNISKLVVFPGGHVVQKESCQKRLDTHS